MNAGGPGAASAQLETDAGTILLLVGIIVREVWQMVQARRRGRAAARLHVQIVGLFSVIAVLPAVLVSIVAAQGDWSVPVAGVVAGAAAGAAARVAGSVPGSGAAEATVAGSP